MAWYHLAGDDSGGHTDDHRFYNLIHSIGKSYQKIGGAMTPQDLGLTTAGMLGWIMAGLAAFLFAFALGFIWGYSTKEKENEDDNSTDD
jgi:hypothetical protein